MKKLSLFVIIFLVSIANNQIFAQGNSVKTNIKVWGNCGMCKERIEKAAKSAGAESASWNSKSHELALTFNDATTSSEKIQQAIAAVGHDTQDFTADNNAYNNLHGCCKYDRKGTESTGEVKKSCSMSSGKTCAKDSATCSKGKSCAKGKSCCKKPE